MRPFSSTGLAAQDSYFLQPQELAVSRPICEPLGSYKALTTFLGEMAPSFSLPDRAPFPAARSPALLLAASEAARQTRAAIAALTPPRKRYPAGWHLRVKPTKKGRLGHGSPTIPNFGGGKRRGPSGPSVLPTPPGRTTAPASQEHLIRLRRVARSKVELPQQRKFYRPHMRAVQRKLRIKRRAASFKLSPAAASSVPKKDVLPEGVTPLMAAQEAAYFGETLTDKEERLLAGAIRQREALARVRSEERKQIKLPANAGKISNAQVLDLGPITISGRDGSRTTYYFVGGSYHFARPRRAKANNIGLVGVHPNPGPTFARPRRAKADNIGLTGVHPNPGPTPTFIVAHRATETLVSNRDQRIVAAVAVTISAVIVGVCIIHCLLREVRLRRSLAPSPTTAPPPPVLPQSGDLQIEMAVLDSDERPSTQPQISTDTCESPLSRTSSMSSIDDVVAAHLSLFPYTPDVSQPGYNDNTGPVYRPSGKSSFGLPTANDAARGPLDLDNSTVPIKAVVSCLLVSGDYVLLAERGPESGNEDLRGRIGGIGGKVDEGESLEDAAVREVREEVGIDIDGRRAVQFYTEEGEDNFFISYFMVYCDSQDLPQVPMEEQLKVVNPKWYNRFLVRTEDLIPGFLPAWDRAQTRFPSLFAPPASAAAISKWLYRGEDNASIPDGFEAIFVNNQDGLCTVYALNALSGLFGTPADIQAKFGAGVGRDGYAPQQLVDTSKTPIAVWDCRVGKWVGADPARAIYHLRLAENGNSLHYDALRRAAVASCPQDVTIFPNGRGPGIEEPVAEDNEPEPEVAVPINNKISTDHTMVPKGLTSLSQQVQRGLRSARAALVDAGNNTVDTRFFYRFVDSLATTTLDVRDYLVNWGSSEEQFTKVTHDVPVHFGMPDDSTQAMINLLYSDGVNNEVVTDVAVGCSTINVKTNVYDGGSRFWASTWMDTAKGPQGHHDQFVANTADAAVPERLSQLTNDLQAIFPRAFLTKQEAAVAAQFATTTSDVAGSSFIPMFERLLAAWMLSTSETVQTHPANYYGPAGFGAAQNGCYRQLFPMNPDVAYIFNCPTQPANPAAGLNRVEAVHGVSGCTILPLRRHTPALVPPIDLANNRDWRAPLAAFHLPYCGLFRSTDYVDVNAANQRNTQFDSVFTSPYGSVLPRLTILTTYGVDNINQGAQLASLINPDSYLDAIRYFLQNFGRSADFLCAMHNVFRRSARFISPMVTELPTLPIERLTNATAVVTTLRRRLILMRINRPNFDLLHPQNYRVSVSWDQTISLWNAPDIAGNDISGPNAIPFLAAINNFFPQANQLVAAHCIPFFPDGALPNDQQFADMQSCVLWHQFFSRIDILEPGLLEHRMRQLTTAELDSILLWLHLDYFALFGQLHAAIPALPPAAAAQGAVMLPGNAANYRTAMTNIMAVEAPDQETARTLAHGGRRWRRDWSLPVHNMYESFQACTPNGSAFLRSVRLDSSYHTDQSAIHLAHRLKSLGGAGLISRFAYVALSWRAATDSVSSTMSLTAAQIAHAAGSPQTGNPTFDAMLMRTSDKQTLGGIGEYVSTYISALDLAWRSVGWLNTIGVEYSQKYTKFELAGEFLFPSALISAQGERIETVAQHLVWRVLHPVVVGLIDPELPLAGGIVSETVRKLGIQTPTSELPWDAWYTTDNSAQTIAGITRLYLLLDGRTVSYRPCYVFNSSRAGIMPTAYRLWESLDDVSPRISDSVPWTPTLAQDFLWFLAVPAGLKVVLDVPKVNGRYAFINSTRLVGFDAAGRLNNCPVLRTKTEYRGRVTRANPNALYGLSLGQDGYNMLSAIRRVQTTYPGMLASYAHPYEHDDGRRNRIGDACITWFSRMMSANRIFNRSEASHISYPAVQLAYAGNQGLLTGPDNNGVPGNYFAGAAAGMSNRKSEHLYSIYVVQEDLPGMPAQPAAGEIVNPSSNPHLVYFYAYAGILAARWKQWFYEPSLPQPLILLSSTREVPPNFVTGIFDPRTEDQTAPAFLRLQNFVNVLSRGLSAQYPDLDPLIAETPDIYKMTQKGVETTDIFNAPKVVDIVPTGQAHFNSGMAAKSAANIVVPDPPEAMSAELQELRLLQTQLETARLRNELADELDKLSKREGKKPQVDPPLDETILPSGTSRAKNKKKVHVRAVRGKQPGFV